MVWFNFLSKNKARALMIKINKLPRWEAKIVENQYGEKLMIERKVLFLFELTADEILKVFSMVMKYCVDYDSFFYTSHTEKAFTIEVGIKK